MKTPKIVERIREAVMDMRSMNMQPTDVFLCTKDVNEMAEFHYTLPTRGVATGKGGYKYTCCMINIDNRLLDVHGLKSGEQSIITVGDIRESKIIRVL